MAQLAEHVIGNDEVISSNLITSSKNPNAKVFGFFFFVVLRRFRQICQKLCQFVSVNYKINYKWRRVKSSAELVGFGTKEI